MQGKKIYKPKMMYCVQLHELVPEDNYYRKLAGELDLQFLYKETKKYYGAEGQGSIDPIVFFKICLTGYLNNITSDRKLIEYCSDSLAIRLFIQYDIDEPLPWHSTISRTRQLYGEEVFLLLFKKVLSMCINKGMVRGKRQAIDSAFIKSKASLDSVTEKEVLQDAEQYAEELQHDSEYPTKIPYKEEQKDVQPIQPENSTGNSVKKITKTLRPLTISNSTHYSPTDTDARLAFKPGKPRLFYYSGHIAVDDAHHVITGALVDFADKRDHETLPDIAEQTIGNLKKENIVVTQITADAGYSSATSLQYCEEKNIDAYIPNRGRYIPERDGFIYNEKEDRYECQRGNKAFLVFKRIHVKHGTKVYSSSKNICKNCPLRKGCLGEKLPYKQIEHSTEKILYDKMYKKMQTSYAWRIKRIRSSTVEPVLGTLLNFTSMKRVNTIGIQQANKHLLMAAFTYNLKKYLAFKSEKAIAKVQMVIRDVHFLIKNYAKSVSLLFFCPPSFYSLIS